MRIGPVEISWSRRSRDIDTRDGWTNVPFFGPTMAGVTVTSDNPITHDTVFSCINVIAEGCAMLPMYLYRGSKENQIRATDHPLYPLLLLRPTAHMTAFQFWKLVMFEKLHYGNHYSLVLRNANGEIIEIYPLPVEQVQPFWYVEPATGLHRRAYRVSTLRGQATLLEHEIFHIANLPILRGIDYGLRGMSVWQWYQAETIGGALATQQFANKSMANGASLSGMISVPGKVTPEVAKEVRQMIQEQYAGSENAGKIGIFGNDAKFTQMSQTNQQAQLIETRKFNRSVIAGILRVSAHLINDLEKATYSNIEQLDLGHYNHCLRPHLVDLCQVVWKDLLTAEEQRELFVDHDESELLRGDQATRAAVLEKAVQNARLTPNEARALDNRPPLPGGDRLYINAASVPLDQAGQRPPAPAAAPDRAGKGEQDGTAAE